MLQAARDPVVEILRIAYRRGLAIRQAGNKEIGDSGILGGATLSPKPDPKPKAKDRTVNDCTPIIRHW